MKTNTLKLIVATAAVSALALLAAGNLTAITLCVSYTAVAILLALAALDYGPGPKSYMAR